MLTPIIALSSQQAKTTQATMRRVQHFLNYAATKEPAVTTYHASDMVLAIHSNAGYLNEEGARSRARGHHFLSQTILRLVDSNTILTSSDVTSQSYTDNFFTYKVFFLRNFTADSFIRGGECHMPWYIGGNISR